jgi:hypothetical protein
MDSFVPIFAALVGSAGLVGIAQLLVSVSKRRRLRYAIEQLSSARKRVDDRLIRQVMQQAIDADALRLATMSLVRPGPSSTMWIGAVGYLMAVLSLPLLTTWWLSGWNAQLLIAWAPLFAILLFVLIYSPMFLLMIGVSRQRERHHFATLVMAQSRPPLPTAEVRAGRALRLKLRTRARLQRANRRSAREQARATDWARARRIAVRRRRFGLISGSALMLSGCESAELLQRLERSQLQDSRVG